MGVGVTSADDPGLGVMNNSTKPPAQLAVVVAVCVSASLPTVEGRIGVDNDGRASVRRHRNDERREGREEGLEEQQALMGG